MFLRALFYPKLIGIQFPRVPFGLNSQQRASQRAFTTSAKLSISHSLQCLFCRGRLTSRELRRVGGVQLLRSFRFLTQYNVCFLWSVHLDILRGASGLQSISGTLTSLTWCSHNLFVLSDLVVYKLYCLYFLWALINFILRSNLPINSQLNLGRLLRNHQLSNLGLCLPQKKILYLLFVKCWRKNFYHEVQSCS